MTEIDVRDCPDCERNGKQTKGNYDGRVMYGGRGVFTCPECGARWQDAEEKPSTKGVPLRDLIGDPNFDPKGDDELSV